ncbi:effector-associated constant component EACC1 [Pseudomonas sp. NY15181]|uniref:effector-associated constant component EACC1 n=1 Tax=Pseudomonas sp. NY15181 TaxID=3400349 RepID=UPI003A879973
MLLEAEKAFRQENVGRVVGQMEGALFQNWRKSPKMEAIRVNTFKGSHEEFIAMLQECDIRYGEVKTFSSTIMASGMVLMVYGLVKTAAPWAALAAVLVAWVKSRSSRKVIITTKDNKSIQVEGYSVKDVERFLEISINLAVIDTDNKSDS